VAGVNYMYQRVAPRAGTHPVGRPFRSPPPQRAAPAGDRATVVVGAVGCYG
jgi:hypothetical protein